MAMFRGAVRSGALGARCFSLTRHNLALTTFNMADVGEGIKEVEVLEWFVKEGDRVEELQRLCEVQSDKATAEITSRYTGTIKKIYTSVGDMQQVGSGLVDIDTEEDGAAEPEPVKEAPKKAAPKKAAKKKAAAASGVKTFNLADIGEGIKEVEILQWMVKEGDVIEEMDKLCEVQSDKATVELTTPWAGKVVKVHNPVGDMQQVGAPLVDIEVAGGAAAEEEEEEEAAPAAAAAPAAPKAAAASSAPSGGAFKQSAAGAKVLCAPAVRRIAAEKGVDLSQVTPTGKGGRVTKADLINFMDGTSAKAAPAAAAGGAPAASAPIYSPEDKTVKISGRARLMVQSMNESLKIPSFGAADEINLNNLVKVRSVLKPVVEKRGAKLSYMPFFVKAASLALKEVPIVNTQISEDQSHFTFKGAHNIGIAMDTAEGLVVPNIKDVQSKSIFQIAQELGELQKKGAANAFTTADLQGGTFTLSNIGSIGGTYVSPVIMAPQTAIGALGKIAKLPKFNAKGEIEEQNTLYISWTADHRIIDGATMVRFSNAWKQKLEDPSTMLLDLM